ncbi:hypothetical protein [Tahibacter amnicola]|uniref:Outer membrane lipoprotein-sorting protein n=1 Tax=Tahibacter amnicola TaxID=2976241 RepID=A0ABY6BDE1_9GAMM|nr:hypothetical protein [Tahibacter amnicola]UXI68043.1 hypothetical protein N4264_25510 [Tahibacter amnicola]
MTIRHGLFALLAALAAGSAQAISVDELVAKNIEARGGLAKIQAIQSLRLTGRTQFSGGGFSVELGFLQLQKRGDKFRAENSLQGLTAVSAYDGKDAWQIQPFQGRKDPEKLSADQAKSFAQQADIDGPLVDWRGKGHKVEYLGLEDVDGTPAHKLKVARADGDTQFIYLDPDYFLEIRVSTISVVRGVENEQENDLGNYEAVNGVFVPFSIESGPKGQPKGQKLTIEKAEANVEIDDAVFSLPAAK